MRKFLLLVVLVVAGWLVYKYVWAPKPATPPVQPGATQVTSPQSQEPPTSGMALFKEAKYKEAAKRLEEEINNGQATDISQHLSYIAVAYDKLEQPDKSAKCWDRLLKEFPESPYCGDAYYELGRRSKDRAQKTEYLETAMMKYPQSQGGRAAGVELGEYYISHGDIPEREFKARRAFSLALKSNPTKEKTADLKKKLADLNRKLVFSPFATADSVSYTVIQGDSLASISTRFKVVPPSDIALGHLRRVNNLKNTTIFPGDTLKIITGQFWVVVNKQTLTLTLYLNDDFVKEYPISVGNPDRGNETPAGEYHITGKLVHPNWTKRTEDGKLEQVPYGDPRNVLGTRWMGLKERPRLGIHGTTKPESIGKQVSEGCIRMYNSDVEEVYDLLPDGAKVVIE